MNEYLVKRGTRTTAGVVQAGWIVEFGTKRLSHPVSILFETKIEAEREANRLALLDAQTAKGLVGPFAPSVR